MKLLVIGDFHGEISKKLKKNLEKVEFDFIIGLGDYAGIEDWRPYINYVFKIKDRTKIKGPKDFFGKKKFQELMKKDFKAGEQVLKFLDNLGKKGFFVFGNGDDEWYNYPFSKRILKARKSRLNFLKRIKNLKEMTYKIRKLKGIEFLGFGGYMDAEANRKARDHRWQEAADVRTGKANKKMDSQLKKIEKNSIFILHYPPKGVFDIITEKGNPFKGGSTGIKFFRDAIVKKKPFLVLCGHMHEYQGKKKIGNSVVVNPGDASAGKFSIIDIDEKKKKINSIKFYK